jgi:ABC-type uncharacterized transport system ATPase subunit
MITSFFPWREVKFTLLGEYGAGKSTLINILYGLYQPDERGIYIQTKPVKVTSKAMGIQYFYFVTSLTNTVQKVSKLSCGC